MKKAIVLVFVFLSTTLFNAYAEDYYWVGESGSWYDSSNWSPTPGGPGGSGPPPQEEPDGSKSNAFIINSGATDITVSLENPQADPPSWSGQLTVDATGTGSVALLQSQDNYIHYGNESIGIDGTGIYTQTGGVHFNGSWAVSGRLLLGVNPTGNGTYNLEGGELSSSGASIGGNGIGTFNQSGGSAYFAYSLDIGCSYNCPDPINSTGQGVYNLSGGSLEIEGDGGHFLIAPGGTFNQSGGTFHHSSPSDGSIMGTYNLSGGTLSLAELRTNISGTFNQSGGTFEAQGFFSGLTIDGVYNMSGGNLTFYRNVYGQGITNNGTFNYSGGSLDVSNHEPGSTPATAGFTNNGNLNLYGNGTRAIEGDVVNNGTVQATLTNAVYNGTFTNNGAYISFASNQYFNDLIVGPDGYLVGQFLDSWNVSGDFINYSTQNTDWNTSYSNLSFLSGLDSEHDMYLVGEDFGALMSGYSDNYSWGVFNVNGAELNLVSGIDAEETALYSMVIYGLDIDGNLITNIHGNGLNIYYLESWNSWLNGLTYEFSDGGQLIPVKAVPEPATILLLGIGLFCLAGVNSRRNYKNNKYRQDKLVS